MATTPEKKANTATKILIKAPLKTAAVAAGIAVMFGGHALGEITGAHAAGAAAHEWGMKVMEESFKEIDSTFGK